MLTGREKRLLRRWADGKPDAPIATEIGGTKEHIGALRERLLTRLGISSDGDIKAAAKSLARWPYRQRRLSTRYWEFGTVVLRNARVRQREPVSSFGKTIADDAP